MSCSVHPHTWLFMLLLLLLFLPTGCTLSLLIALVFLFLFHLGGIQQVFFTNVNGTKYIQWPVIKAMLTFHHTCCLKVAPGNFAANITFPNVFNQSVLVDGRSFSQSTTHPDWNISMRMTFVVNPNNFWRDYHEISDIHSSLRRNFNNFGHTSVILRICLLGAFRPNICKMNQSESAVICG